MKKKVFYSSLILILFSSPSFAQISVTNGRNTMEITGIIGVYYNARFLNPSFSSNYVGNTFGNPLDKKKDVFSIPNARLKFEGRIDNKFEYKFQLDLSRLGYSANGENPAVVDLNFTYKGIKYFNIITGYQKIPFSATSMSNLLNRPYWQRAELVRGGIFSRRDIGVTLTKTLWRQRINLYGGVYSGMGEYILTSITNGDNDSKGTPEFVGRADISTSRFRYNDIYDSENSAIPKASLGFNARYVERLTSITGVEDYDLKIVQGKKTTLGMDAALHYRGFSAQFEIDQLIIHPKGSDTTRLQGKNTDYFRAGGLIAEVNYYSKKLKSGVNIRYDNFIPNDLIKNNMEQTLSLGYNYFINGYRSFIKIQYLYRLDKNNPALLRTDDELRVGWQQAF